MATRSRFRSTQLGGRKWEIRGSRTSVQPRFVIERLIELLAIRVRVRRCAPRTISIYTLIFTLRLFFLSAGYQLVLSGEVELFPFADRQCWLYSAARGLHSGPPENRQNAAEVRRRRERQCQRRDKVRNSACTFRVER